MQTRYKRIKITEFINKYLREKPYPKVLKAVQKDHNSVLDKMYYKESSYNYKGMSYFIDALAWKRELFLYELLGYAGYFVKKEEESQNDCVVILNDCINPFQIPAEIEKKNGKWRLCEGEDTENKILVEDERYLAAVIAGGENIEVFIYKKTNWANWAD